MLRRIFAVVLLIPLGVSAQANGPTVAAPQISATATAEVQLRPDRAALSFAVESHGVTAAAAGAETARKQRAVLDTLRILGIAADQMTTASIEISPELDYTAKPPRVAGYLARNSVRIDIRDIEKIGALIDGALAHGATRINSLVFSSSKADEARRQALELAVAKAKGEAESMAKAAGGSLGGLIQLDAQPSYQAPIPMNFMSAASVRAQDSMPIEPGQMKISATVTGRWGFQR